MSFMIVALGPNDLEVPCMFFEKTGQAEKYLRDRGCTQGEDTWDLPDGVEGEDDEEEFFDDFFVSYSGGCGWVTGFDVRPIVYGQPVIEWDLD